VSATPNVTTLALLNLIRLLAAELVAGENRDDVGRLISAMDRQLNETPLPRGIDVNDARAGIARARDLLRPYVKHVRELAAATREREQAGMAEQEGDEPIRISPASKYLQ
jgi:hypothetical protein